MVNAAEIAQGLPVSISVKNIKLENGNIVYEDKKVGSKIHLKDFSVGIPAVYLSNKQTDVGVSFKFADGGDLNVKVLFNMQTQDFTVSGGSLSETQAQKICKIQEQQLCIARQ